MWEIHCTKSTIPLLFKTQVPNIPKLKAAQGSWNDKEVCPLVSYEKSWNQKKALTAGHYIIFYYHPLLHM